MTNSKKTSKPKHAWTFKRHIKPNTFNWKSSQVASKRLKEALSEIKAVAKKDSRLAAYGITDLAERIWPSLEHIDSSSGALGTAVCNVLTACVPIFSKAELEVSERNDLLERTFEALQEDGVDYLSPLGDNWGDLCAGEDLASQWADRLISTVELCWVDDKPGGYFAGTTACLSSLLKAKRYGDINELMKKCPVKMWHYARYQFNSLVNQGKKAEAIRYADQMADEVNEPIGRIYEACEQVLLSSGLYEEAYQKYGLMWTERNSNLATFRAIAKKYPQIDKKRILRDLIAEVPGDEGKWFATAKDLGEFDLAIELVSKSPCDPKTLNRAASKYLESNPEFAMNSALASLRWLCEGYGYEITNFDVIHAYKLCMTAASHINKEEETLVEVKVILSRNNVDDFVASIVRSLL